MSTTGVHVLSRTRAERKGKPRHPSEFQIQLVKSVAWGMSISEFARRNKVHWSTAGYHLHKLIEDYCVGSFGTLVLALRNQGYSIPAREDGWAYWNTFLGCDVERHTETGKFRRKGPAVTVTT